MAKKASSSKSRGSKKTPAWTRKEGKSKAGGLNEKGRRSYERENPGSNLQAPVSRKQAAKSKAAAGRRKKFCARMQGMKQKLTGEKTARDPDSPINKALRRWDCG